MLYSDFYSIANAKVIAFVYTIVLTIHKRRYDKEPCTSYTALYRTFQAEYTQMPTCAFTRLCSFLPCFGYTYHTMVMTSNAIRCKGWRMHVIRIYYIFVYINRRKTK